jgi:hypothetical protein
MERLRPPATVPPGVYDLADRTSPLLGLAASVRLKRLERGGARESYAPSFNTQRTPSGWPIKAAQRLQWLQWLT